MRRLDAKRPRWPRRRAKSLQVQGRPDAPAAHSLQGKLLSKPPGINKQGEEKQQSVRVCGCVCLWASSLIWDQLPKLRPGPRTLTPDLALPGGLWSSMWPVESVPDSVSAAPRGSRTSSLTGQRSEAELGGGYGSPEGDGPISPPLLGSVQQNLLVLVFSGGISPFIRVA